MIPLLQSDDGINTQREVLGYGLSQATFAHDQITDQQRIHEDLYNKIKNGDQKGTRYILGINNDDSLGQVQSINVCTILDQKRHTLLMHAAWKNHTPLFLDLLKYSSKQFGENETKQWILLENDAGHQCMHIASQKGNVEILEAIRKYGINLDQPSRQGLSCLHIAAQADQPIQLYYLVKIAHLDMNLRDAEQNTALHVTSFYGSETCAGLLLSWGCSINLRNTYGLTPLHTTAMSGYQRITRRLLVYNAKTRLKNKQGKTAHDLAQENDYSLICKMIKDYQDGNIRLNNLSGSSNRAKINEKIRTQMYIFITLIVFNLVYQICFTIGNNIYGYVQIITDILLFIFFILVAFSDPGFIRKYKDEEVFYQILNNNPKKLEICPECETLKPDRSKHCDFCKRCVMVYDHHCPWINNCVGAQNHLLFIIFIDITWITITLQLIFSCQFLQIIFKEDGWNIIESQICTLSTFDGIYQDLEDFRDYFDISKGVKIEWAIFEILTLLVFFYLLSVLTYMQHSNVFSNQTTFEKFGKGRRGNHNQQSSLMESCDNDIRVKQSCSENCLNMLCRNKNYKEYRYSYEDSNSITTAIIS